MTIFITKYYIVQIRLIGKGDFLLPNIVDTVFLKFFIVMVILSRRLERLNVKQQQPPPRTKEIFTTQRFLNKNPLITRRNLNCHKYTENCP